MKLLLPSPNKLPTDAELECSWGDGTTYNTLVRETQIKCAWGSLLLNISKILQIDMSDCQISLCLRKLTVKYVINSSKNLFYALYVSGEGQICFVRNSSAKYCKLTCLKTEREKSWNHFSHSNILDEQIPKIYSQVIQACFILLEESSVTVIGINKTLNKTKH